MPKAFDSATDPKSLTHDRFVGTPAFASAEQFEHSALDVRSDIYSLAETLWFALTGKPPFAGRTLSEIHRAQKSNALPVEQLKAAHVVSNENCVKLRATQLMLSARGNGKKSFFDVGFIALHSPLSLG